LIFLVSLSHASTNVYLSWIVYDQAPDYIVHSNFPSNYWTCAFSDNPTVGSAGTANGGVGFNGTDFELPEWQYGTPQLANATTCTVSNGETGLVGALCTKANSFTSCGTLGSDDTPQYAYTGASPLGTVQSPASFYNWFHSNLQSVSLNVNITLSDNGTVETFNSTEWFPIDGEGWGDSNLGDDGNTHNFGFCAVSHGDFGYVGGETITIGGDDDIWVYINKKLVIDLGGIHTFQSATFNVDDLGLSLDDIYGLDIFKCERHTPTSQLFIQTTAAPPPPPYVTITVSSVSSSSSGSTGSISSTTSSSTTSAPVSTTNAGNILGNRVDNLVLFVVMMVGISLFI